MRSAVIFALIFLCKLLVMSYCTLPSDYETEGTSEVQHEDINILMYNVNALTVQLEKWNNLFLTSLEPRISASAAILASLEAKLNNLQERAHAWDNFQLHVAAWNDQLSTLDRKVDIVNKAQEGIASIDTKMNSIASLEYKIESVFQKINSLQETFNNSIQATNQHIRQDSLFGEFATRGILSTIKTMERKIDKLVTSQQDNLVVKTKHKPDKSKISIKCNIPRATEELLKDVSSKIDVIFDRTIDEKEESVAEYDLEEYAEDGSGEDFPLEFHLESNTTKRSVKKYHRPCKSCDNEMQSFQNSTLATIGIALTTFLENQEQHFQEIRLLIGNYTSCKSNNGVDAGALLNQSIADHFKKQMRDLNVLFIKYNSCEVQNPDTGSNKNEEEEPNIQYPPPSNEDTNIFIAAGKNCCEDLKPPEETGIYIFGNTTVSNFDERSYNKRFCIVRAEGSWTVIQRRDNFPIQQNFSLGWDDYKNGFGNMNRDFWFGNDHISRYSLENDLTLRIELEDFEDNRVWAEYSIFKVLPEEDNYQLFVENYRGSASDAFSSHNGSLFSTIDRKNDDAPECCPCSDSYGGGWWFNRCFDSNLNGAYHRQFEDNGYFRGIIWEQWKGNYSLKRSTMMVQARKKRTNSVGFAVPQPKASTTDFPYYEDP